MEIALATIIAGFLISTVGFSVFLYGKGQARIPQLIAGVLLMLLPFVVHDALWMSLAGVASVGGLWAAVRMGC